MIQSAVMIPCPCCRASNTSGVQCRRCRADLTLLWHLEERRKGLIARARQQAIHGMMTEALASLDKAAQLRPGDDIRRFQGAIALLAHDFPTAWGCHPMSTRG